MPRRFVSFHEMRWHRHHSDEIDAMLEGSAPDGAADVAQVAAVLRRMRSSYDGPAPRPSAELAAFMEAPSVLDSVDLSVREHDRRRRTRMLTALSGFLATLTGKVVLGTAVAAASVGGLHAADVVDMPVLPDNDPPAVVEQHGNGNGGGDVGTAGGHDELPDAVPEAVRQYIAAVEGWADCVVTNAGSQSETAGEGAVTPQTGCDARPQAADFGLTDVGAETSEGAADNATEQGQTNSEQGQTNGEQGTTAKDDALENDPTSQGSETPGSDAGSESAPDDVPPEDPDSTGDDPRSQYQP